MNIKNSLAGLLTVATLALNSASFAGPDTDTNSNGVTLAGHDAVSYFTENAAVKGSANFTAVHNNAIYYFSSADNRDTFNAQPTKYAPEFGGFCAYGAALGKKFDVNGKAFEIVNGKLYVNKNEDVYETWVEDKAENIEAANKEWPTIKDIAASDL
jgi:YHS domain-containing protein